MKVLIITDTHLKPENIDLVKSIFSQAFDLCVEKDIDTVYFGGDWFTIRHGQTISSLVATCDIIEAAKEKQIEIRAIAGNHDKDNQESEDSFLSIFDHYDNFGVVKKSKTFDEYKGAAIHMLPYFPEKKNYTEFLEKIFLKKNSKNYLITHVAVDGVKNNDGSEVTSGVAKSLFNKFDKVFVGHYHNASKVGKNIHYIGSAYQANFGEDDQKGVTILDTLTGETEFIQLYFPKYMTEEIEASKVISHLDEVLKGAASVDFLRVKLVGTEAEIDSVDKNLLRSKGIKVEKISHNSQKVEKEDVELISFDKESLQKEWDSFSTEKEIPKKRVKIGKNYLEKLS